MKKRKFRIGQIKQSQQPHICPTQRIAPYAKRAMDYFAPLVRAEKMSPAEAMVLIAMKTNGDMQGNEEASMTMTQIHQMANMIIDAWKQDLFAPCDVYPYTLEQTLAALNEEE